MCTVLNNIYMHFDRIVLNKFTKICIWLIINFKIEITRYNKILWIVLFVITTGGDLTIYLKIFLSKLGISSENYLIYKKKTHIQYFIRKYYIWKWYSQKYIVWKNVSSVIFSFVLILEYIYKYIVRTKKIKLCLLGTLNNCMSLKLIS